MCTLRDINDTHLSSRLSPYCHVGNESKVAGIDVPYEIARLLPMGWIRGSLTTSTLAQSLSLEQIIENSSEAMQI